MNTETAAMHDAIRQFGSASNTIHMEGNVHINTTLLKGGSESSDGILHDPLLSNGSICTLGNDDTRNYVDLVKTGPQWIDSGGNQDEAPNGWEVPDTLFKWEDNNTILGDLFADDASNVSSSIGSGASESIMRETFKERHYRKMLSNYMEIRSPLMLRVSQRR